MAQPDYLLCLECESPTYLFEWVDGRVLEAQCTVCGNEDPGAFATEEEIEEMGNEPWESESE